MQWKRKAKEAPVPDGTVYFEARGQALGSSKDSSPKAKDGENGGRIIVDAGRDTYVRRWFWETLNAEASSDSATDDERSDVEDCTDSLPTAPKEWQSGNVDSTHPSIQQAGSKERVLNVLNSHKHHLWKVYKERVEPLTKLLHLPSLEQSMIASVSSPASDPRQSSRCILLSLQYGAVTSLSEEECGEIFSLTQAQILSFMREIMGKIFSDAMLIHTGDIQPLQALVLYIIFLRHHEPRLSWNLTGLAVRLAQNFGIHREGTLFRLSKFDIEMRRRLWWQIAVLDTPSAEDYSGEYNLLEMSSCDTQMPRNLNDTQLRPAMMEYPSETRGITEMTFTLARCQITSMYRCMIDSRRICGATGKPYSQLSFQERSDWIDCCESAFSQKYLRECSPTVPFHWVTVILTRMLFHKVRLHGCNPLQEPDELSETIRKSLFLVAVEVIELNYKLRTDPRTRPWAWLFSSYTQWHSFSLVLVWLQQDPLCKGSRRAWEAIEKAIVLRWEHPLSLLGGKKPQQWRSIIRQLGRARSIRQDALGKRKRRASRASQFAGATSAATSHGDIPARRPPATQRCHQPIQQQPHFSPQKGLDQAGGPHKPALNVTEEVYMSPDAMMSGLGDDQSKNSIPGFNYGEMSDVIAPSDTMMIDEEFSTDEFQSLPDFLFLQSIFQNAS
ncbi:hypothetical protein CKAH01_13842 [Colletotrichum kahawae]|uniref:Xylanolytic transcriptional activator regulatory domain-containing protein n=1 Tax=Colletotrichum kahawae TaxID=34407 RepID=A0AAE0DB00_COLKA|nr:hypothetical protein CKAH01_13842 [Colletotrichum kahawae]